MKLFQTSQNEVINTSMITNIKPIHSREIGPDAERLYTKDEYSGLIHSKDVKKCRVMNQEVPWSQVDIPVVAYKVTTTNGSVVISVPDYERLIKSLSDWLTEDTEEDEDIAEDDEYYDNESVMPAAKLTQSIFKSTDCPDWAEYAAVDKDGEAYLYEQKPKRQAESWIPGPGDYTGLMDAFDSSNWENSLIKRPERS